VIAAAAAHGPSALWYATRGAGATTTVLLTASVVLGITEERGWRPGEDLWRVAPGHAIGGDRFGNREGLLPAGNPYVEADLDYAGGRRGPARLIFVRESQGRWLMWVTADHYRSFRAVQPR